MRRLVFLLFLIPAIGFAEGPRYAHEDSVLKQEFDNIYQMIRTISTQSLASGTTMVFSMSACPSGWTQVTTNNDMTVRISSATGGGTAGTNNLSAGLSHTHTANAHTHAQVAHQHVSEMEQLTGVEAGSQQVGAATAAGSENITTMGAAAGNHFQLHAQTVTDGATTTGSGSDTGMNTPTPTFKYLDVIVCSKG